MDYILVWLKFLYRGNTKIWITYVLLGTVLIKSNNKYSNKNTQMAIKTSTYMKKNRPFMDPNWQLANCCNAVFSCCCHTCRLSVVTRWNTLNIAVNQRLINWGAAFRCCQICCLVVVSIVIHDWQVWFLSASQPSKLVSCCWLKLD